MIFKHYEIQNHENGLAWYGYKRIGCPATIDEQIRDEKRLAHLQGMFSERECEVDCFLSVLSDIDKPKITLLDLGTGWGEWSMALGGMVKKQYYALAVECDKKYAGLALDNFVDNHIQGTVIYGAVGESNGKTKVNIGTISDKYCGSSLSFGGYFSNSRMLATLSGMYHTIFRKTDTVPMYSVDYLIESYLNGKVDFAVMDIQGAEMLALNGWRTSQIDYLMIGTHGRMVHKRIVQRLKDREYEILVNARPDEVTFINDTYRVICQKGQDGIVLCKRKS